MLRNSAVLRNRQRQHRDTAPGISLLMEWWTIHHRAALQSLARDARRSHRSVEGDVSPHREREETAILYKRV